MQDSWHTDPAQALRNYVRINGDLSGNVAPFWWQGAYVAVTPTENPVKLFACEGCETRKVIQHGPNEYEVWSKVMTMFKDPDTLEVLNGKTFENPFTGETNSVEPNVIGSKMIYELDGAGQVIERPVGMETGNPLGLTWTVSGDKVQLSGQREYPPQRPIPLAEFGTTTAALADVMAPSLSSIDVVFASTFLAPWQPFLNMGDTPGHSVWHAVGRKAKGFHELSAEYLEQAEKYIPDVLAWADDD